MRRPGVAETSLSSVNTLIAPSVLLPKPCHSHLQPKNILVNSNCKLKVCDLGLARPYVAGQQPLTPVMWTEYVATRWYRAPELCGQFYGKYTGAVGTRGCMKMPHRAGYQPPDHMAQPAAAVPLERSLNVANGTSACPLPVYRSVLHRLSMPPGSVAAPPPDIWSVGCIFAEVLLGKPLFPGRDLVHQLQLITDLLGKPPPHVISAIHNARARAFLATMPAKEPRPFASKFPGVDPPALELLARMLSFDPADRPTAEEALAHPYFSGMPSGLQQQADPVAPHFEFERYQASLTEADVRHLIYREALHYHPEVREVYMRQAVRSRNPYPLVSTPSESVSLQFMLQSDSGDSSSFCDPLSSETCTSHPAMQQHHNHQQQQQHRYSQQQQQQRAGYAQQQQYSGNQQRPTSGGSSASAAPGSAAQHAAAAVGSALSSALLQPADPANMGAAAAAAAGYGLGTVSASSKAPWDPPTVAQNGYVPCAYPHHPPGHLYSQPGGYSAQQHQAAVLQQYHQALPAALASAVGAANMGRCIPEPLGGAAYPSAAHATS